MKNSDLQKEIKGLQNINKNQGKELERATIKLEYEKKV